MIFMMEIMCVEFYCTEHNYIHYAILHTICIQ
jgi:hypothetical protein